jgi:hypothetical protein
MAKDGSSPTPTAAHAAAHRPQPPTGPAQESAAPPSALDRLRAAADALKRSIEENMRGVPDRVKDGAARAVATYAPVLGEAVRRAPLPRQVQDVAESPEKLPLEAAKKATTAIAPAATPLVKTVADAVERSIDRARDPGGGGRTP